MDAFRINEKRNALKAKMVERTTAPRKPERVEDILVKGLAAVDVAKMATVSKAWRRAADACWPARYGLPYPHRPLTDLAAQRRACVEKEGMLAHLPALHELQLEGFAPMLAAQVEGRYDHVGCVAILQGLLEGHQAQTAVKFWDARVNTLPVADRTKVAKHIGKFLDACSDPELASLTERLMPCWSTETLHEVMAEAACSTNLPLARCLVRARQDNVFKWLQDIESKALAGACKRVDVSELRRLGGVGATSEHAQEIFDAARHGQKPLTVEKLQRFVDALECVLKPGIELPDLRAEAVPILEAFSARSPRHKALLQTLQVCTTTPQAENSWVALTLLRLGGKPVVCSDTGHTNVSGYDFSAADWADFVRLMPRPWPGPLAFIERGDTAGFAASLPRGLLWHNCCFRSLALACAIAENQQATVDLLVPGTFAGEAFEVHLDFALNMGHLAIWSALAERHPAALTAQTLLGWARVLSDAALRELVGATCFDAWIDKPCIDETVGPRLLKLHAAAPLEDKYRQTLAHMAVKFEAIEDLLLMHHPGVLKRDHQIITSEILGDTCHTNIWLPILLKHGVDADELTISCRHRCLAAAQTILAPLGDAQSVSFLLAVLLYIGTHRSEFNFRLQPLLELGLKLHTAEEAVMPALLSAWMTHHGSCSIDADIAMQLVAWGPPETVHARDFRGRSLLHFCSRQEVHGRATSTMVASLLAAGADSWAMDAEGRRARPPRYRQNRRLFHREQGYIVPQKDLDGT